MRKKILLISYKYSPDIGGIETVSEFLYNGLRKAGFEVKVITTTKLESKDILETSIYRNPTILKTLKLYFWADLVFENNITLKYSIYNLLFRKPLITSIQTHLPNNIIGQIKSKWLSYNNNVISCSNFIKNKIKKDATVIHNPYNNSTFRIVNDSIRKYDFVFLGRLVDDKGVILALEAFRRLNIKKKCTFTIIGEGPELNNIVDFIDKNNLTDLVFIKGKRTGIELNEILNQHKIIIVPSLWQEPFGIVAAEGMGSGCIPIVADRGGLPEVVGSKEFIYHFNNIDELVDKMEYFLEVFDTNEIKNKLRSQLEKFSEENILKCYLTEINKFI